MNKGWDPFLLFLSCRSASPACRKSDRESNNCGPGGEQACSDSGKGWDDRTVFAKDMWKTQINKDADPAKPIIIIE